MKRHDEASHFPAVPNRNGSYEDHVMAAKALPSKEVLRQLLRYEPDTGKLFWKERLPEMFREGNIGKNAACKVWNGRYAGNRADRKGKYGYCQVRIFDVTYYAHRITWIILNGEIPKGYEIDHINGERSDNVLANLRLVSRAENSRNLKRPKSNSSGSIGVRQEKGKWAATIVFESRKIFLGYFDEKDQAIKARRDAQQKFGFHANHGRDAILAAIKGAKA